MSLGVRSNSEAATDAPLSANGPFGLVSNHFSASAIVSILCRDIFDHGDRSMRSHIVVIAEPSPIPHNNLADRDIPPVDHNHLRGGIGKIPIQPIIQFDPDRHGPAPQNEHIEFITVASFPVKAYRI